MVGVGDFGPAAHVGGFVGGILGLGTRRGRSVVADIGPRFVVIDGAALFVAPLELATYAERRGTSTLSVLRSTEKR